MLTARETKERVVPGLKGNIQKERERESMLWYIYAARLQMLTDDRGKENGFLTITSVQRKANRWYKEIVEPWGKEKSNTSQWREKEKLFMPSSIFLGRKTRKRERERASHLHCISIIFNSLNTRPWSATHYEEIYWSERIHTWLTPLLLLLRSPTTQIRFCWSSLGQSFLPIEWIINSRLDIRKLFN